MKRKYETVVIFDGSLSDDAIEKEHRNVEEFLTENTDFEKTDVWGKKNLAYVINKKKSWNYYLYFYEAEGNISELLNKRFKLNRKILRQLTVLHEKVPDIKAKAVEPEPVVEEEEE